MTFYKENPPFIDFQIWVKPGSSKEAILPPNEKGLIIHIHAKPQDGQANESIRAIVSKWLQLPKSEVVLLRGEKSRHKWLRIPLAPQYLAQLTKMPSNPKV
jgi:uncharacterized protein (TIGR00251 family)